MKTQLSLTEAPIPRALLTFALPILPGNFLLFGVLFGFSMASTVMVAQCIGARKTAGRSG